MNAKVDPNIFLNEGGQREAQMKLHSKQAYKCWKALKARIALVLEKDKKYKQKYNDTIWEDESLSSLWRMSPTKKYVDPMSGKRTSPKNQNTRDKHTHLHKHISSQVPCWRLKVYWDLG